ncbi:MAG TPA: 30S ribosome-binding factor RbfA [Candidatus Paceibacterota bacterium]|nr:30S ribosome-binding factor RbfA [Candidatus Paceibacterota bacterium]
MADSYRLKQLNSLIQQLFSEIIQKESNFSDEVFISVSKVEVSKDLANAKVFISVFPAVTDEIKEYFKKNIFALQQLLNKKLDIHPVPKILIVYDESEAKAAHIDALLNQIKNDARRSRKRKKE